VKAGQVTPLDDLLTPQVKDDFDPHALAENTIDGHIYAVKMLVDTGVIYYRKSLFKKAGITHPPTTFAELLADAKKLTKGGVKGLFIGNDGGIDIGNGPLPWSAGVELLNKKGDKVTFDNARTVKAWEALRTLNKAGVLLLGAPIDWWDPSAFTQGLAAMQWCGLWAMPGVRKGVGNDFGVVAWPALDGQGKPATFWGGWSEMVNGHSKHIKEAKAFVKWLWIENTKAQIEWNTAYGFHVPPRKSAVATANKLETGQARDAVAILRKYSHNTPPTWDAAMQTALDDAVAKVIKTNQSITQLVHSAAKKAQAELNRELK
jgi:multiple sugar transport system substrate-binding protein